VRWVYVKQSGVLLKIYNVQVIGVILYLKKSSLKNACNFFYSTSGMQAVICIRSGGKHSNRKN
jgi:hypothetical protein